MFIQEDDNHERPESRSVYLETCFTTLPESYPNTTGSVMSEPLPETNNFLYKQINGNLTLDKNKNLDMLHKKNYSFRSLCNIAPLAEPEHFSDTESNKSYGLDPKSSCWTTQSNSLPPSCILKAPQMMRRTPKIIGSLSTCTDDIRNLKSFEKAKSLNLLLEDSNSSSNLSNASVVSYKTHGSNDGQHFVEMGQCSWQRETSSALRNWEPENYSDTSKASALAEEMLDEILEYADCADFFNSNSSFLEGYDDKLFDAEAESNNKDCETSFMIPTIKLTKFPNPSSSVNSPLILSPCSLDADPDIISNFAMDLNLDQEHRSLLSNQHLQTSILKPSSLEIYTEARTSPCTLKTVTFNPDISSMEDKITLHKSSDYLYQNRERSKIWNFIPFKYFNKKVQEAVSMPNITKTESVSTIYSSTIDNPQLTLTLCNEAKSDSDNNEHLYSNAVKKRKVCLNSEV